MTHETPHSRDIAARTAALFDDRDRLAGEQADPGTPRTLRPLAAARVEDDIVRLNLGLADGIAGRYCGRGIERDDLVQVARLGLVKAVRRFHTDRGVAFPAFATPTITGEVKRHFRDHGWAVRPPRRLQELHARIGPTGRDLEQRLHRPPTSAELAVELGVEAAELTRALEAATGFTTLSFDHRPGDDAPSLSQLIPSEDDDLTLVEHRVDLHEAIETLTAREQRVVRMRFGDDLTQAQIALQLGVSQMQVSRILTKILEQLHRHLAPEVVSAAA